ncbi:MAG: tail fiber domain-containing protein, partial [Myxococcota bacterium]
EANAWRIFGGICSPNDVCLDLHPGGDGNDTMVVGVRMESNGVAVQVGGAATYIAFNRFEGNGSDVVRAPTSQGTVLLGNDTALGTDLDLSELNPNTLTALPLLDGVQMGIVPNAVTTELGTHYVAGGNLLRTVLSDNQHTEDGVTSEVGYAQGYAGWQLEMDGSASPATSEVRLAYRAPGSAAQPAEVLRVGSDGTVYATAFSPLSDQRLKRDVRRVDDALGRLTKLQGVRWRWADGPAQGGTGMGLIAQDVEQVFPEAVNTSRDGTKSVSYDGLTAPIVEAITALAQENAALRARVAALEAR